MLIYSLIFIQLKYEHQILKYEQKVLVEGICVKGCGAVCRYMRCIL